ncbi:MAG TPA: GAF domain-containing protein, partial [Polyangia bacterium]|nr:GAF domain-containing protein [Polyangia bacterium]
MNVRIDELAEVAQALARRTSLDDQLQHLVERTAVLLGVERVGVRLLDPTRGRLIAVARAGAPLHRAPFADFGIGEGLMGWVVQQQKPLTTGDAEADPRFVPREGMLERLGSFVAVPLMVHNACIGVLYASHTQTAQFGADHEQLLTLLAGLCAPHIESARLTRLSEIDALTGALNRRGATSLLDEKAPLSVVMCDLDWFKRI